MEKKPKTNFAIKIILSIIVVLHTSTMPVYAVQTIFDDVDLDTFITAAINWGSGIIATVCVLMLIVAGYQYITSAGNPEGVEGAKRTIELAIGGLILLAIARLILAIILPGF